MKLIKYFKARKNRQIYFEIPNVTLVNNNLSSKISLSLSKVIGRVGNMSTAGLSYSGDVKKKKLILCYILSKCGW